MLILELVAPSFEHVLRGSFLHPGATSASTRVSFLTTAPPVRALLAGWLRGDVNCRHRLLCLVYGVDVKLGNLGALLVLRHLHTWQTALGRRSICMRAAILLHAIEHLLELDLHDGDGVAALGDAGLELLAAEVVVSLTALLVELSELVA